MGRYPEPQYAKVVLDFTPLKVGDRVVILDNDEENSIHLVWMDNGSVMGTLTTCDFGCLELIA